MSTARTVWGQGHVDKMPRILCGAETSAGPGWDLSAGRTPDFLELVADQFLVGDQLLVPQPLTVLGPVRDDASGQTPTVAASAPAAVVTSVSSSGT